MAVIMSWRESIYEVFQSKLNGPRASAYFLGRDCVFSGNIVGILIMQWLRRVREEARIGSLPPETSATLVYD